jgi:hypothetical protein
MLLKKLKKNKTKTNKKQAKTAPIGLKIKNLQHKTSFLTCI